MGQLEKSSVLRSLTFLLVLLVGAGIAGAQPVLIPMGQVQGGPVADAALSGDGTTVVGTRYFNPLSGIRGMRWTSDTGWQFLTDPVGGPPSFAFGVNRDGTVISGFIEGPIGPGMCTWNSLGIATLLPPSDSSRASDVSNDGQVIVGSGSRFGFRWTPSEGFQSLQFASSSFSAARAVSGDGTVVVGHADILDDSCFCRQLRAFVWTQSDGMVMVPRLPGLPGTWPSTATAISSDGSVVVGGDGTGAFRWHLGSQVQELSWLAGSTGCSPMAVSEFGTRIVGLCNNGQGFVWDNAIGLLPAVQFLQQAGIQTSGLEIQLVSGISDDGTVLLFEGTLDGVRQTFVAKGLPRSTSIGACCSGTSCSLTLAAGCSASFVPAVSSCGTAQNPVACCRVNVNQMNGVSVQDIFDFLAAWFGGNIAVANFNADCCITVQDLFDFLGAYFAGC